MRGASLLGAIVVTAFAVPPILQPTVKTPAVRSVDDATLREYAGVYQWGPDAFVYLQLWNEFTGFDKPGQLVAFDESGEIRVLYPSDRDRFFTGAAIAVAASVESRIEFERDAKGKIASLTRRRDGAPPRIARRVDIEQHEPVRFSFTSPGHLRFQPPASDIRP